MLIEVHVGAIRSILYNHPNTRPQIARLKSDPVATPDTASPPRFDRTATLLELDGAGQPLVRAGKAVPNGTTGVEHAEAVTMAEMLDATVSLT
jgi:hypothetical protein